ncbi:MAG: lactate utilization protein [Clostridia bacterium]|nr:lactate utilization protein [Clostridia bacterium]NCC68291.1 lactate utilization protein [Clostridia bacterium]
MDLEKLRKNLQLRGFDFKYFETGEEAADYINGELDGETVGIGGSKTVDSIKLYEKLIKHNDVAWHWKQEPVEARARAAAADVYISSANGIAETGEIINIDGNCNRVASTMYGKKKVYIVAGVNKIEPDYERALWRARNIAAPLNARRFNAATPCAKGEMHCHDCSSPARICRGLTVLWGKSFVIDKVEVVIINEELGY